MTISFVKVSVHEIFLINKFKMNIEYFTKFGADEALSKSVDSRENHKKLGISSNIWKALQHDIRTAQKTAEEE